MALPPFRLPRLQLRMPIVNVRTGTATTAFHRYLNVDVLERIEAQEAAQAATDAALQAEIDRLNRVLAGLENFTGIQVGSQQVRPFLDQTDGTRLVNPGGLDDSVVTTPKIIADGVVLPAMFYDATGVLMGAGVEIAIATVVATAAVGDTIDLTANATVNANGGAGNATLTWKIYRDAVPLYNATVMYIEAGMPTFAAPTIAFSDMPGAGTFTYTVKGLLSAAATANVLNRYMRAVRYLKTGA
jgi:hypothetical protein